MNRKNIQMFVRSWNVKYPIDKWWRFKYNVPFNSPQHNAMTLMDMRIEYEESLLFEELLKSQEQDDDLNSVNYNPAVGNWLDTSNRIQKMTREEIDSIEFDNISLDDLDNGMITIPKIN